MTITHFHMNLIIEQIISVYVHSIQVMERLRNSHWSHLVAFLMCTPNGSTHQIMTSMASYGSMEPFTCHFCATPKSHKVAPMAFAQPV
jgi:hypothetical protein